MALSVAELAGALRVGDGSTDPPEPVLGILTRQLAVANAIIGVYAPDAPEEVREEAAVRAVGYWYDQPTSTRGDFYGAGFRNSGAQSLLRRFAEFRAGIQADAPATPGAVSSGLTKEQVQALIDAAIANLPASGGGQTAEQVKAAIDAAIANLNIPAPYVLPAATATTRGGVLAVTNAIIDAGTSIGVFGWTLSHVRRVAQAIADTVRSLPAGGTAGQAPRIASNGTDLEWFNAAADRSVLHAIERITGAGKDLAVSDYGTLFILTTGNADRTIKLPASEVPGDTIAVLKNDVGGTGKVIITRNNGAQLFELSAVDSELIIVWTGIRWIPVFGAGLSLSDEIPQASGTAAAGDGTKAARDDHVHPAAGEGGAKVDGLEHRLDVVEAKTADLAAGAEPGAFATVTDVAAQGGLSASRSTRPSLQQAQTISAYAAKRNPSTDSGIYVVRLPITVDKNAYRVAISPGELSGLQAYTLPAGAWHRLGADENYQYFYFPYPYRLASVTLQVAANADHIGSSAYHGHVLDAQLLDRIQNLARLTADLQQGGLPAGWSATTDAAIAGVAFGSANLTAARAASYALSVSGGGNLLIRVRRSDDPSQFRVRYSTTQGDLAYRSLHELQRLGPSAGDPPVHDYYFGGNILAATHESITVEVTGTAAHAGTSKFRGVFDGTFEDGIVDMDALADVVAKRLLPATFGDAGQILRVNDSKTAAEWFTSAAGGGGLFTGAAINVSNTQTGFKASTVEHSKAGEDGLDLLLISATDFSATDVVPLNEIVRSNFIPTVTADAMTGGAQLFPNTNDEVFIGLIEGETAGKGHLAVRRPSGKTGSESYSFFRLPIARA